MNAPVQPPAGQPGTGPKRPAKPGAMTMAMRAAAAPAAGPKVLRIGVLQSGRIIEERVIRRRETVTIGTSERNHFTVQAQGLPGRFDLFQLVGGDYILNFTEAMEGRVGLPSGVQDLTALRTSGGARNVGSHWQVKLTEQSRGKVSLGGVTFLFQFVTPPPVQPRPALPAAVVGGAAMVIGVDWMFTAFVVFSFLCHFGFVIYLDNADWPLEQGVDAVPDAVARLILQEPEPPPRPQEAETTTTTTDQAATTEVAETAAATKQTGGGGGRRASAGGSSGDTRGSPGENSARIREQAAAQAQALLLGAFGGSGGSAIQDVLRGGAVTSEAADVFAQTRGVGVAQGGRGGTLRQRSGGGTGGGGAVAGDLGSLRRTTAGGAGQMQEGAAGGPQERVIRGRASAGGMRDEGGSGTLDEGAARRALAGGARCVGNHYSRYLTQTRDRQRYTLRVSLTVTASGGASSVNVEGAPNGDLQSRAASCFRGIRMPPPEGGSVQISVPIVLSPPADM
ncbi:MAG: hypothetical protein IT379_14470 [Deltaproteobacteria bacterium]|nr:hypothetical protein [Deltaproteobacteria bacterium]